MPHTSQVGHTSRRALVTGASSGIGAAFADRLAQQGYDLVLVARRGDRLSEAKAKLERQFGISVEVQMADLADAAQLAQVEARLEAGGIDLLVNNAGIGDIAPFSDQDRDIHDRMIRLNVLALTRLTHAAVPKMIAQGGGSIINVASGFAFDFMPGAGVYAATKSYVVQLTNVLHEELAGKGIRLQALIPGLTRTELGGAAESGFFDRFPPEIVMEADALVAASLAGLELGELVCLPRLEDSGEYDRAHAAIRAVGRSPGHNKVASRYSLQSERASQ